jgi:hypothetical protein
MMGYERELSTDLELQKALRILMDRGAGVVHK